MKDGHFDGANNDLIQCFELGTALPTPGTVEGMSFAGWYADNTYTTPVTTFSSSVTTYYGKWIKMPRNLFYDFEDDVLPGTRNGLLSISTDYAAFGSKSMKVAKSGDTPIFLGEVYPETTYVVEFYANIPSNTTIKFGWMVGPGWPRTYRSLDENKSMCDYYGSWNGWHHISFEVTMPATNTHNYNGKNYTDLLCLDLVPDADVYLDNITVTEKTSDVVKVKPKLAYNNTNDDYAAVYPFAAVLGTVFTKTPTAREGYEFAGWYTDAGFTTPYTTVVAGVDTIYAKWNKITTPVNFAFDFEGTTYNTNNSGVLSTDYAHSGTKSMYYSNAKNLALEVGKINPGQTYGIDMYVFQPTADVGCTKIRTRLGRWPTHVAYNNGATGGGERGNYQLWDNKATSGWKHISFTITTPENLVDNGTLFETLWFVTEPLRNNTRDEGPLYVDDISIVEMRNGVNVTFADTYDLFDRYDLTCARVVGSDLTDVPAVRDGYTFDGWYTGANGTGDKVTTVPTTDTTVYANWKSDLPEVTEVGKAAWYELDGKLFFYDGEAFVKDCVKEITVGVNTPRNICFNADGSVFKGLKLIDGKYYYFSSGKSGQYFGKVSVGGKTYNTKALGYALYAEGWNADKTSYYELGEAVTGLKTIDGLVYYFDNAGVISTGFKTIEGKYYYFVAKEFGGHAYTGEVRYNGKNYKVSPEGGVGVDGWTTVGGAKAYILNGQYAKGLTEIDGLTYFFGEDGAMETGLKEVEGTYYYFVSASNGGYAYHGKVLKDGKIYVV